MRAIEVAKGTAVRGGDRQLEAFAARQLVPSKGRPLSCAFGSSDSTYGSLERLQAEEKPTSST